MNECIDDRGDENGKGNTNTKESRYNVGESKVIAKVIADLIESNIPPEMIGVITP